MLRLIGCKLGSHTQKILRSSIPVLQQRFAETQAAAPDLNWDELQDFVTSDEAKRELSALRTAYLELQDQPEGKKSITVNWDQYKGDIEPETLAVFQKAYSGLKFPNYDPSKEIKEAKEAFEPLYKQAEELAAYSEKRLKEIDRELKALQSEKERISQLTIDEELANDPETAKQIDKEIAEGDFLP